MTEKTYVETSIFSFYYDVRPSPAVVARREWTRQWWNELRQGYEIVTSAAVLAELDTGSLPHRAQALRLALTIPAIPVTDEGRQIAAAYIKHRLMPNEPGGDALHLALASFHKCDYLVTWNCKHLANARKFEHLHRLNDRLGLYVPALVTPLELLGVDG